MLHFIKKISEIDKKSFNEFVTNVIKHEMIIYRNTTENGTLIYFPETETVICLKTGESKREEMNENDFINIVRENKLVDNGIILSSLLNME